MNIHCVMLKLRIAQTSDFYVVHVTPFPNNHFDQCNKNAVTPVLRPCYTKQFFLQLARGGHGDLQCCGDDIFLLP